MDSGGILAALIRLLGDFDLAGEAMHEAFAAAPSRACARAVPLKLERKEMHGTS
jgi:RNA polymerase sigma-70 factor (ECF subfamily)